MTSPPPPPLTDDHTSRLLDATDRLIQAYRDLGAIHAESTTVCALCGDQVIWHPGNGGQWLGANPPRDWATCGGVVDGPRHQTHHEANIAAAAKHEERTAHLTPDEISSLLDQTRAERTVSVCAVLAAERDGFPDSPGLDPVWIAGWHAAADHLHHRVSSADHAETIAAIRIAAAREALTAAAAALPAAAKMPWLYERGENDWWGERTVAAWLQERVAHPLPTGDHES